MMGFMLFFCSKHLIVTGRVAVLEAVPQAVISASTMFPMNLTEKEIC